MVRTNFQLDDSLPPWPRRRLEAALAAALGGDSADAAPDTVSESPHPATWQRLRNLAAAYGCRALAQAAHERFIALTVPAATSAPIPESTPVMVNLSNHEHVDHLPIPPRARDERSRRPLRARKSSAPRPVAGTWQIEIQSAVPQARRVWLERYLVARGCTVSPATDAPSRGSDAVNLVVSVPARAAGLLADLLTHPELVVQVPDPEGED